MMFQVVSSTQWGHLNHHSGGVFLKSTFAIEAIYLAENGVTGKLGAVFWMSAISTLLHMLFQLNELFIT